VGALLNKKGLGALASGSSVRSDWLTSLDVLGKRVEEELWGHQPVSSGWTISPVVP
jgi:hypothetical protein